MKKILPRSRRMMIRKRMEEKNGRKIPFESRMKLFVQHFTAASVAVVHIVAVVALVDPVDTFVLVEHKLVAVAVDP